MMLISKKFIRASIYLVLCVLFLGCTKQTNQRYVFFLHNRFIEEHDLRDAQPEYGRAEYQEILKAFKAEGFTVMSEKRKPNADVREYAIKVKQQIDDLLTSGVDPSHITVIGTSKGGYIAQYVSTFSKNPKLNFVFIACYRNEDIRSLPDINFCGNILTIYERSDELGVSAIERKNSSTCKIVHFKEIELNTGLKHGFQFRPLKEWIDPSIKWASGIYDF